MIAFVDSLLNRVTMYRLTLYYLATLLLVAFGLGLFKLAPSDPAALAFSFVLITAVCWAMNRFLAWLLHVPANRESVLITALILTQIMPPAAVTDWFGVAGLVLASVVAIASKFLLTIRRRHIFNPVAIGVAVAALALDQPATWWVAGNLKLLPFVLVGGLLIVRKMQRFEMISAYVFANLAATLAMTPLAMSGQALTQALQSSPLLFAGFAMLTEPATAPEAKWPRIVFGAIVGALSSPIVHFAGFYLTPEIAFLVGNAFAFAMNPQGRFKFTLVRIEQIAADCFEFVLKPDRKIAFRPGQYLDWTLDVRKPDDRGNRRPFTIASAPSDGDVRLGVKFYPRSSAFKRTLAAMKQGDVIYGSQIAGAFTLPDDPSEKLAFIAGGIGVTPFRSMVRDLIGRKDKRSAVLLYGANKADEIAYADLFEQAERELGLRTVYAVAEGAVPSPSGHRGFIDAALIRREVPDFLDRTFYVSGPWAMVSQFRRVLREMGVARTRVRVDFFPGFA
jgi:ferredoxin-NADP reductase/Na+-translocating ferredoxin:NAD+ oxidoreductase RnfD subunit